MAKRIFSKQLLAAAKASGFNSSEWTPVDEPFTLEELWDEMYPGKYAQLKDTAKVVAVQFEGQTDPALRIELEFKNGGTYQLKVGKGDLEEGDVIQTSSIYGQELTKMGSENIVRYYGELV